MLLLGCGALSEGNSSITGKKPLEITLTERDNGGSVTVPLGANLVLRLNETPGSGFRWEVDTGDQKILELHRSDYIPAKTAAVGGSGQRVLEFEAKRSGSVRLVLKLLRAWEGDKSLASRFEVTIHVIE
jgi:inhibitor of cysteine peptidase